jgi:exosome complex protein LRP1
LSAILVLVLDLDTSSTHHQQPQSHTTTAMDPQIDLPDLVEDLEVNIDELTDTLSPLLSTPLSTTATSLPLLDKAKLYVLAAYAIESLLFSTLQASGVDAKSHALFAELARLRTYFAKIKDIEERAPGGAWENRARVDKDAAARFIKHGLSGNERYDRERAERTAREKARAAEKAKALINKKFDDESVDGDASVTPKKRGARDDDDDDNDDDMDADEDMDGEAAETTPATKKLRTAPEGDAIALPKRGKGRSKKEAIETPVKNADADASTPARSTRSAKALQAGAEASPAPAPKPKTKGKGKGKGKAK